MKILKNIGNEILPNKDNPLVGTYHPGFYYSNNKNGALEKNIKVPLMLMKMNILINISLVVLMVVLLITF